MIDLRTDGIYGLLEQCENRRLLCFGAGNHFDTVMNLYGSFDLITYVSGIIDNNSALKGSDHYCLDRAICVLDWEEACAQTRKEKVVILITCHLYSMEIVEQLDNCDVFDGVPVYVGSFLSDEFDFQSDDYLSVVSETKIPKVIHYCWFGNNNIPDEYQRCMESWEKYCPEYKIIRWDESNYDVSKNRYMKQAYDEDKWAFVSDYARIDILYRYGGIYLDCDVELCKSLNSLLSNDFYCGFEDKNHVNLGLGFGSVSGHLYLKELLHTYDSMSFVNADGTLNMTPCTAYQTDLLKKFGLKDNNSYQKIGDMTIYPTDYFAPISPWGVGSKKKNTVSIHHYGASWQSKDNLNKISDMYNKYFARIKING